MANDTLTQQTIHKILNYIRERGLQPGDFLPTEAEMVEEFQVSRVIIREAFSYLKGLGLITSRRGSGFRVAEVDFIRTMRQVLEQLSYFGSAGLKELFSLRRVMEVGAICEAVKKAGSDDIAAIVAASERLDRIADRPGATASDFAQAELCFHRAIMKPANCRMLDIINAALDRYFMSADHISDRPLEFHERLKYCNEEHRMIAAAFKTRRPELALLVLNDHLSTIPMG